jgi:hypothetical protein
MLLSPTMLAQQVYVVYDGYIIMLHEQIFKLVIAYNTCHEMFMSPFHVICFALVTSKAIIASEYYSEYVKYLMALQLFCLMSQISQIILWKYVIRIKYMRICSIFYITNAQ